MGPDGRVTKGDWKRPDPTMHTASPVASHFNIPRLPPAATNSTRVIGGHGCLRLKDGRKVEHIFPCLDAGSPRSHPLHRDHRPIFFFLTNQLSPSPVARTCHTEKTSCTKFFVWFLQLNHQQGVFDAPSSISFLIAAPSSSVAFDASLCPEFFHLPASTH
ncbi:hypothetical protein LZ32DRAFT_32020 [Colletotrichum eremochloae]|nr:hypothetical protein LZ32DRAFT_32020 [Colletotrichum eremochloae]